MDLTSDSYRPFLKPDNPLIYVHKESNHPPLILENIPKSVNKRLSELSKSEEIFIECSKEYQTALNNSGYKFPLKYETTTENSRRKKQRRRNILWFNPPYSKNIKTNIGKEFFKLLDTCFPAYHILNPIIIRNSVKLSYNDAML